MSQARPRPVLFLFGAPRLERDGQLATVDTRKALALIAYLAMTRTRHSRDALATLLWSEYDQSRARAALRRTLSVLNSALGGDQLDIDRENVGLNPDALFWVDVEEFRKRLSVSQKHSHPSVEVCPRCIAPLAEAVALYRDDFMAGFTLRDSPAYDEWQFFQSESLRRELGTALEKLTRYHSAASEFDMAIVYARRWLSLDLLHEPAHRQLMQLYAWTGQRAAALRQYQECVRVLRTELGVAPLEETTHLYDQIKEQRDEGSEHHSQVVVSVGPAPRALASPPQVQPFVGREAELTTLLGEYQSRKGAGCWIALDGEAGIGKTRLAETFLVQVRGMGASTISARCYEGGANLAYGPFIEGLRDTLGKPERSKALKLIPPHFLAEAARLLPELNTLRQRLPALPPLDSPGAQSRFFEGIRQVLLALATNTTRGVLFIDDVQWADSASLALLTYLVQRLRSSPLFILSTWRGEQMPSPHSLRQHLTEAERAGTAREITLGRLSAAAVTEWAQAREGTSREIGEHLYRETEGLPFFIVEYLAALGEDRSSAAWTLPGGVRSLLHSRLNAVGETSRQLLSTGAVLGRSFDFDTLRETSGRSEEETVTGLEELIAQGLVKEVGNSSTPHGLIFDFSHDKLRELAYAETSQARRRLLHRRAAESVLNRARAEGTLREQASQIAFHYQQGGRERQAAEYYHFAGEHARSVYANAQALAHFRAALALHHPDQAALYESIGDLQMLQGDYGAALSAYNIAANVAGDAAQARLEHKRGNLEQRRGEWKEAERHFRAALERLGETGPVKYRSQVFADWSLTLHQCGQEDEAQERARRALELAEEANDPHALAQAHNIFGILANRQGDSQAAEKHLEQSAVFAEALGDPEMRAAALNNLALAYQGRGDTQRALQLTQAALELTIVCGDRHREAALHNNLADLHHSLGDSEAAMSHLKQAVLIFSEIGGDASNWQPGIWKLVEW